MRDDPMMDATRYLTEADDNVVVMPDLVEGALAELLAAAGAPAQEHELRGELAARTAFRSAVDSWPSRRRLRGRRTPAVVAATTMAALMVASTGLSAATGLPGPVRAVDGILGSVGVHVAPTAPPVAPRDQAAAGSANVSAPALQSAGSAHVACTVRGRLPTGTTGQVETASCIVSTAPSSRPAAGSRSAVDSPGPAAQAAASPRISGGTPGRVKPPTHPHRTNGPASGGTHGTTTPPTTVPPGGGTSRGGNQGLGGGGGCKGGSSGSTTTTTTTPPTTTTTTAAGTTSTTQPSTTSAGSCAHGGGHDHGSGAGQGTGGSGGAGTASS